MKPFVSTSLEQCVTGSLFATTPPCYSLLGVGYVLLRVWNHLCVYYLRTITLESYSVYMYTYKSKVQNTYPNWMLHNVYTIISMTVVVIPIIIIIQDSNLPLSESLRFSLSLIIILTPVTLGVNCNFSGVFIVCVTCFLLCVVLCCFYVYTCNSKSIAGVSKGCFRGTLLLRTIHMRSQQFEGVTISGVVVWRTLPNNSLYYDEYYLQHEVVPLAETSSCGQGCCAHDFSETIPLYLTLSLSLIFILFLSDRIFDDCPCEQDKHTHAVTTVTQHKTSCSAHQYKMMMIAFITIKSSLVPLIEGLCVQIYFRFEISVVCSHLLVLFFVKEKIC